MHRKVRVGLSMLCVCVVSDVAWGRLWHSLILHWLQSRGKEEMGGFGSAGWIETKSFLCVFRCCECVCHHAALVAPTHILLHLHHQPWHGLNLFVAAAADPEWKFSSGFCWCHIFTLAPTCLLSYYYYLPQLTEIKRAFSPSAVDSQALRPGHAGKSAENGWGRFSQLFFSPAKREEKTLKIKEAEEDAEREKRKALALDKERKEERTDDWLAGQRGEVHLLYRKDVIHSFRKSSSCFFPPLMTELVTQCTEVKILDKKLRSLTYKCFFSIEKLK